ncbi:MAG: IclR family transcriptional regulator [Candidatus Syntrophonatronum acetioxidans]|uniref:Glycerol operon regulatory protein n=1 Tax=Candidatus Syntrophonatronum acetioxidans TaxID=1795816 RepID=A0A424YJ94_9FIRM|nr:MAG: IclR family transcriptional regulator [Candidatus Syntrophonatronum acetioxidans]
MKNNKKGHRVQSVERALLLLEILSEVGEPTTLSELSEKANLNISTVHRLLHTLMANHFVEQDLNSGKYRLGLRLFEIGSKALYSLDIRQVAKPHLQEVVHKCNETANMAILEQGEVVYIEQVESQNTIKMFARIGSRGPAHCTAAGKALLAYQEMPELERIISSKGLPRFTDNTITEPDKLKEKLEKIRKQGYALDLEEMDEGVNCIAVPIMNHEGKVIAAISISGLASRMSRDRLEEIHREYLKEAGHKISQDLGYKESLSQQGMLS